MAEKPSVIEALSAVMDDVQSVRKDSRNQQQNFNFRGIDAVMNAVGPALRKHGVVIVPETVDARHRDAQTTGGKAAREATVVVTYRAYGPAGDSIAIQAPGESLDAGDKATPKAMSVAYRTALLQALTIPTDDPDPDASVYQRERPQPAAMPSDLDVQKGRVWRLALGRWGSKDEARDGLTDYASDHDIDLTDVAALRRLADQWEQESAKPETGEMPPPAMHRALMAALTKAGHKERGAYLAECSRIVGHDVTSTNNLTRREASVILDALGTPPTDQP